MAYNVIGRIYLQTGAFDRAMTNFQTALQIQPTFTDVHASIGQAFLYAGKLPEAVQEFEQALRFNTRYPQDVHVNLAVTYRLMGNIDAALTHFEEALRADPMAFKGHMGAGDMLLLRGKFKEALEHFRKAVSLNPN